MSVCFFKEQEENGENGEEAKNGEAEAEPSTVAEKENGEVKKSEAQSTTKEDEPGSSNAENSEEPVRINTCVLLHIMKAYS